MIIRTTLLGEAVLRDGMRKKEKGKKKEKKRMLRIKLKCGLVCELTLRVNRHSKGQESQLSHHYVF